MRCAFATRPLALVALTASTACTAPAPKPPPPAPVAEVKPEVDPAALCTVKAEIDDAASRLRLAELRAKLEHEAPADRAAQFGALLAIQNEQDRFHAFHNDGVAHPDSAVGPLGECFVYAAWKMGDQASGRCQMADERLKGAAIVDVARAELNRRKGALDAAQTLVDNALSVDNGCAAALIEGARIQEARADKDKALSSWERARQAWPQCYLCAVEAAKLTEASTGKGAAVPLWEAALKLQPDSPEALKRYGAALAGVDDKSALEAYERAIAAGSHDVATFMGAAQLAGADVDKGIAFAEQAAKAQPNEIDAWRMVLALSLKRQSVEKGDPAREVAAAKEILRLVDEDLPSLLVLARDARTTGNLVDAVLRFDAAERAIAAGRTGTLDAAALEAAKKEHASLLGELKVDDKPARGNASYVIWTVQKTVQGLFADRVRKMAAQKKVLKGSIEVAVNVSESGSVDEVDIVKDTLGDSPVTASVVANLRRSSITGGAKRYSFQMDFQ